MLDYYESYNFLKKPIKSKIKQLTNGKLLNEQPFYNQPIKKTRRKKISKSTVITRTSFLRSRSR